MIDEISINRIHIEKKIRGHSLCICLQSQRCITPSCFDHIQNDKCPNDSRCIMPFVACSFLVLSRKVCFGELFDSL